MGKRMLHQSRDRLHKEATLWFNPMMIMLLKSPLHRIISNGILLITFTGRKSGKSFSTPTNYLRDGNVLWILSWRDRKWWRNLRGGTTVNVLLAGKSLEGRGLVIEEEDAVMQSLYNYYCLAPKLAKYNNISLDVAGLPDIEDCASAAQKLVVIRIELK